MQGSLVLLAKVWAELATLGGTFPLQNREMAFRFRSKKSGEVYFQRYMTFPTRELARKYLETNEITAVQHVDRDPNRDFNPYYIPFVFRTAEQLIRFLKAKKPVSLEFGPVYLGRNRRQEKQAETYLEMWKPLVFDVDMDAEYAKLRTCECGNTEKDTKKICNSCWEECLLPPMKFLHYMLGDVFGFKALLTVFSGRRGFHVWVLDKCVWSYTEAQRRVICDYLGLEVRLDVDVTVKWHHLVKVPLVVHPATGLRAIPIDEKFRPDDYPDDVPIEEHVRAIRQKIEDGREN